MLSQDSRDEKKDSESVAAITIPVWTSASLFPNATLEDKEFLSSMNDFERNARQFLHELEEYGGTDGEMAKIGSGLTSDVFKAVFQNKTVALKVFRSAEFMNEYINEVSVMKQLKSEYLVNLIGIMFNEIRPIIVIEYCANGRLIDWLSKNQDISFREQLRLAMRISYGLVEIHKEFAHGDFNGKNIFLDESMNPKIGDFGISIKKSISEQKSDDSPGTFEYAAPEVRDHYLRSTKSDIYSYGVVLWEISTQEKFTIRKAQIVATGDESKITPLLKDVPEIFQELIKACWRIDPDKRPTAQEIVIKLCEASKELNQDTMRPSSKGP